jgi:hypothetical protein
MGHKNIGYHTRQHGNNTIKVCGGSFGGQLDMETVNRLTQLFSVEVLPSGTPVFVDRLGRRVSLYVTIDPGSTEKGKTALAVERLRREALQAIENAKAQQIEDLMSCLSTDEIIARLRG